MTHLPSRTKCVFHEGKGQSSGYTLPPERLYEPLNGRKRLSKAMKEIAKGAKLLTGCIEAAGGAGSRCPCRKTIRRAVNGFMSNLRMIRKWFRYIYLQFYQRTGCNSKEEKASNIYFRNIWRIATGSDFHLGVVQNTTSRKLSLRQPWANLTRTLHRKTKVSVDMNFRFACFHGCVTAITSGELKNNNWFREVDMASPVLPAFGFAWSLCEP